METLMLRKNKLLKALSRFEYMQEVSKIVDALAI